MAPFGKEDKLHHQQRDSPLQSIESPGFNLFSLPPELRALVYRHYFSYEELVLDPYYRFFNIGPRTLVFKMPLLRANSFVLAEALPAFYRYYLFRVQFPKPKNLEFPPHSPPPIRRSEDIRSLTPVLPLLTRIELVEPAPIQTNQLRFLMNGLDNTTMTPHLQCLHDYCPKLRFLRLTILLLDPFSRVDYDSPTFRLLAQLVKRLDHLEIIFVVKTDHKLLDICESIAPRGCWIRGAFSEGPSRSLRTCVWSFHRGTKNLTDIRTSKTSADEAA